MVDENENDSSGELVAETDTLPEDLEIDAETEEGSYGDKLKKLRAKLAQCEEEKRKNLEDLQRARADFLNSKRRLHEQTVIDKERATDKILLDLVTLVDSFDTAMADRKLWEATEERWRLGVEAIYANLLSVLASNNVVPVNPLGSHFNPIEHEAVSSSTVDDTSKIDTIIAVLQKGFKRNDTVIRPAKVIVGTA